MFGMTLTHRTGAAMQCNLYGAFQSMATLNGIPIAADANGLYEIGGADTANGAAINAFFEFVHDAGRLMRLRGFWLAGEFSGRMQVTITADDTQEHTYTLTPPKQSNQQHRFWAPASLMKQGQGRYWKFRVENVAGADFSIDQISIHPIWKSALR